VTKALLCDALRQDMPLTPRGGVNADGQGWAL
jgi:hypothetical protein